MLPQARKCLKAGHRVTPVNYCYLWFWLAFKRFVQLLKRRCYGLCNVEQLFRCLTLNVEGYQRFNPWHTSS